MVLKSWDLHIKITSFAGKYCYTGTLVDIPVGALSINYAHDFLHSLLVSVFRNYCQILFLVNWLHKCKCVINL